MKLFRFLGLNLFLFLASCSLQLSNGQNGPSSQTIGTLPNSSKIIITPGSFTLGQGQQASAALQITQGTSIYEGIFSISITNPNGQSNLNFPVASSTPSNCILDSSKPNQACNLTISTSSDTPFGSYQLVITMINEQTEAVQPLSPITINVTKPSVTPTPVPPSGNGRVITFVNKCESTVWFAIGDASTNAIAPDGTLTNSTSCDPAAGITCPAGSECVDPGNGKQCFWNIPKPSPTAQSSNPYELAPGQSNYVVIPIGSYDPLSDKVWGGVFGARMGCDATGTCQVGNCPTVNGTADMSCKMGQGLTPPITQAEVTFKRSDTDYYDVEIINGATIGVSFAPNAPVAGDNPYYCGTPGAAATSAQGLPAAPWNFTPPQDEYNFIDGNVLGAQTNSPCSSCSGDKVCGYTADAVAGTSANYRLSCGHRLGYYSSLQLYSLNQSASNQALGNQFGITQPNSPYSNGDLALCKNPPLQSGYNSQAQSVTCGCTNWSEIASPTSQCQTINPAWTSFVLPTITWQKKACPTCYTYPFDDKSSSFRCHSTSTSNTMNYTVTFCPNI